VGVLDLYSFRGVLVEALGVLVHVAEADRVDGGDLNGGRDLRLLAADRVLDLEVLLDEGAEVMPLKNGSNPEKRAMLPERMKIHAMIVMERGRSFI
jgi:hypothetical protein